MLDLLAICDLEIGAVDTIIESLAAEVVPPADPRLLQLLGAANQPELAAIYARTRTPAAPPYGTDGPRGSSHDRHTSSGDTDGDVEVDVHGANDRRPSLSAGRHPTGPGSWDMNTPEPTA